nr:basic proline-rich protein-like [Camelus dromedarius]
MAIQQETAQTRQQKRQHFHAAATTGDRAALQTPRSLGGFTETLKQKAKAAERQQAPPGARVSATVFPPRPGRAHPGARPPPPAEHRPSRLAPAHAPRPGPGPPDAPRQRPAEGPGRGWGPSARPEGQAPGPARGAHPGGVWARPLLPREDGSAPASGGDNGPAPVSPPGAGGGGPAASPRLSAPLRLRLHSPPPPPPPPPASRPSLRLPQPPPPPPLGPAPHHVTAPRDPARLAGASPARPRPSRPRDPAPAVDAHRLWAGVAAPPPSARARPRPELLPSSPPACFHARNPQLSRPSSPCTLTSTHSPHTRTHEHTRTRTHSQKR